MSQNSGPQDTGRQLAQEIVETFGYSRQIQTYCDTAFKGLPLEHITVTIQCPSSPLREEMRLSCEQHINSLLGQKSTPRFGFKK